MYIFYQNLAVFTCSYSNDMFNYENGKIFIYLGYKYYYVITILY